MLAQRCAEPTGTIRLKIRSDRYSTCLASSSEVRFYWLIVGILAVWRITHLLAAEDGPWQSLAEFRRRANNGFFAELFDCFYCLSLWVAAPVAWLIGEDWKEWVLLWFALSGAAILLERATTRSNEVPFATYTEDPEDDDGMLRKK